MAPVIEQRVGPRFEWEVLAQPFQLGAVEPVRAGRTFAARAVDWSRVTVPFLSVGPDPSTRTDYWPTSTGVTFRSRIVEERTDIVGPLALHLQVSTQAGDLDVFASVRSVDRDDRPTGSTACGWLRLSQRDLDEDASNDWSPVHTHRHRCEVHPGELYATDVEIWPTGLVIPPGGRLLLTIGGSDTFDTGEWRHNDSDDRPNATFANWATLHSGPDAPSWLLVPVVG